MVDPVDISNIFDAFHLWRKTLRNVERVRVLSLVLAQ